MAHITWTARQFEKDEDGQHVQLGSGSFGTVYAATFSFQLVAVKQVGGGGALQPGMVEALAREAALQARLAHENVVRVFGLAVDERPPRPKYAIVMARMHKSLAEVLAAAASAAGGAETALPLAWRINALHETALGVAHLHLNRVVHADLCVLPCLRFECSRFA